MSDAARHIADIDSIDGVRRPVWEDSRGRQYVLDAEGEPVFGVYFIPPEPPDDPQPCAIVDAGRG
jgi:hypothetical protein